MKTKRFHWSKLYPKAWREQFGEEFDATIQHLERGIGLRDGADIVLHAAKEHLKDVEDPMKHILIGVLTGLTSISLMLVYFIIASPKSILGPGLNSTVLTVMGLLIYLGILIWVWCSKNGSVQISIVQGTRFGLALICGALVNMSLEHFVATGPVGSTIRGVGMWALMFLLLGAAGSAAYQRTASLRLSTLASIWCAMLGMVATVAFGFALPVFLMPHMQTILVGASSQNGMMDSGILVIRNTLESGALHLLLAPLLAAFFGAIGGFAYSHLTSLHRRDVLKIGAVEVFLLLTGITSLCLVSTLARPERPPFVLMGLVTLGVSLGCAYPIFTTIRNIRQSPLHQ